MRLDRLHDLIPHTIHRIQGVHGALRYHGYLFPPVLEYVVVAESHHVSAVKDDLTAFNPSVFSQQIDDGFCGSGFTASRLTHQSQRLAPLQLEAHAVYGPHDSGRNPVINLKILNFQQRQVYSPELQNHYPVGTSNADGGLRLFHKRVQPRTHS